MASLSRESMIWTLAPEQPSLGPGEVHVWKIPLEADDRAIQAARRILSHDETSRADRFRFERDRRRFTMGHAAVRRILGGYLDSEPGRLAFSYGDYGKPDLTPALNAQGLTFNYSHSRDLALLAVAAGSSLGVDLEFVNREFAGEEIARRYFSVDEVRSLEALPKEQRAEAFFCCWTRKEAFVKALGEGLSVPLDSFSVELHPNAAPALLRVEGNPDAVDRWSVHAIEIDAGYKAALVAERRVSPFFCAPRHPHHRTRKPRLGRN